MSEDTFKQGPTMTPMSEKTRARLEIELEDLQTKLTKLGDFTISLAYESLPAVQQGLMLAQYGVMKAYADILEQRLKKWD